MNKLAWLMFALPLVSFADESKLRLETGLLTGGTADLSLKVGTTEVKSSTTLKTNPSVGLDYRYEFDHFFLGANLSRAPLESSVSSSTNSDTQFSLFPQGGVFLLKEPRIWVGFAIGPTMTTVGMSSIMVSGTRFEISNNNVGWGLAPKAGIDFNLDKSVTLGLGFAYFRTSTGYSITAGTTKVEGSGTVSYFQMGVGIAFRFGAQTKPQNRDPELDQ